MRFLFRKRLLLAAGALAAVVVFYRANYQVPILMYHHIEYAKDSALHVRPDTFERQMEFLKIHGYRVLSLDDYAQIIKSGRRAPWKSVVITFDDGSLDNFTYAFPVLKKMNFPAAIFMITDNIGRRGWLSEEDLRILDDSGITIGSHTVNHAFLPNVENKGERAFEIGESKRQLEGILGHPITWFSYPAGGFTTEVQGLLKEAGYVGAVTTNHGRRKNDLYGLRRIRASDADGSLFNFWVKLSGLYHLGKKRIPVQ